MTTTASIPANVLIRVGWAIEALTHIRDFRRDFLTAYSSERAADELAAALAASPSIVRNAEEAKALLSRVAKVAREQGTTLREVARLARA